MNTFTKYNSLGNAVCLYNNHGNYISEKYVQITTSVTVGAWELFGD